MSAAETLAMEAFAFEVMLVSEVTVAFVSLIKTLAPLAVAFVTPVLFVITLWLILAMTSMTSPLREPLTDTEELTAEEELAKTGKVVAFRLIKKPLPPDRIAKIDKRKRH